MRQIVDLEWARERARLSPEDEEFGYSRALLGGTGESRLQHLFPTQDVDLANDYDRIWVWVYLYLCAALEKSQTDRELFDAVDEIYATFAEPASLQSLVSYMPSDDPDPAPGKLKQKIQGFVTDLRLRLLREGKLPTSGHDVP